MPTPTPTPEPAPSATDGNPLYDALFNSVEKPDTETETPATGPGLSLQEILAQPAKPAPEKKDKEKEPEPKPEAKPAEEDKPKAPKVTRRKPAPEPLPEIPEEEPEPEPATKKKATPKEDPPAEPEIELLDEERDALELAEFAEQQDGAKYKGYAGKLKKFYKAHADFLAAKRKEDPEYDFSEDNPEYQAWLRTNRPAQIPQHEVRKLERERIRLDVSKDAEEKVASMREELRRRDEEPKIKARATQFWKETAKTSLPDDLAAVFKEKGAAAAREEFPMEYNIADQVMAQAATMVEEFLSITQNVKKFDATNEMHSSIVDWINQECDEFAANGGKYRIRDGKQFVPRTQFNSMTPAARAKAWTFSNDELLQIAQGTVKRSISAQIEQQRAQLEKLGYVRGKKAAAAPTPAPAPEPKPTPPAARGDAAPGAAPTPPPEQGGNVAMSLLGY